MPNFQITVLGSGTMVPSQEKNPAGFLVSAGNKKILLDAGHGTIRRLVDLKINLQDIDYVFISHFHTDHFGDAFSLVHSRWVDDHYNNRKHKKLTFFCPKGTKSRFKLWRKIFWVEKNEEYPLEFKEGPKKFKIGDISLEILPIKHVKWFSSVGIVINYKNKKIAYTGDIGSDNNFNDLLKKVKNSDLLIIESSYENRSPNHYTIEQAKELSNKAGAKKTLIVHVKPQNEKSIKRICKKDPKLVFSKDKEVIKLL